MSPSLREPNGGAPKDAAAETPAGVVGDDSELIAKVAELERLYAFESAYPSG